MKTLPENIQNLVSQGALFYVSHSGGKDSQAMYNYIQGAIPHDQIVVVHSDLGEVEWEGVQDHIKSTVKHDLNVVRAGKTLFDMVRTRNTKRPDVPSWPSSQHRQCTSDLKRAPIQKFTRNDMKARGSLLAVNCMGFRIEESAARAKRNPFTINKTLSKAGRTVYDWLPIHDMTLPEVWANIASHGQSPHWAYGYNSETDTAEGNQRLSCVFCIMGSPNDLQNGRASRPDLYDKYIQLEVETNSTLFHSKSLSEMTVRVAQ